MCRFVGFICLFAIISSPISAEENQPLDTKIIVGEKHSIYSDILKEDQKYTVILPQSYNKNSTKHYPVVYVLDGKDTKVLLTSSIIQANRETFPQLVPEAIVVGIPSNKRFRDYTPIKSMKNMAGETAEWMTITGGADKYREYLEKELFLQISNQFRTNNHRILIGHSLGGLFALYDLLSGDRLFQSYVVIDPSLWFADKYLEEIIKKAPNGYLDIAVNLYVAVALADVDDSWKRTAVAFLDQVEKRKSTSFYFKQHFSTDENHNSIAAMATHYGLRYAFHEYAPPAVEDIAKEPSLVTDHFEAFSKRIGVTYMPEELWVRMSGYNALNNKLNENAFELFQMNIKNYPENSISWGTLGVYYEKIDKPDDALTAYTRALQLNPDDRFAKAKIEKLSEK